MTTAPEPVAIDTAELAKARPVGKPVHVRIGGEVFLARCPKDAVLAKIEEEESQGLPMILGFVSAILGSEAGARVEAMLGDPDVEDVSIGTLYELLKFLMEDPSGPQWGKALADSVKALGSGQTPRTIPVRKTAARKTAARKR